MNPEVLRLLASRFDALVIESFGVGGLPCYEQADSFPPPPRGAARASRSSSRRRCRTRAAIWPSIRSARAAAQPGILQAYTMTVEAVVTKLMWILPQTRDLTEIKRLFYTPDCLRFASVRRMRSGNRRITLIFSSCLRKFTQKRRAFSARRSLLT